MTETELTGSVAALDLTYYDAGAAQWSDHSTDATKTPALIRLAVRIERQPAALLGPRSSSRQ